MTNRGQVVNKKGNMLLDTQGSSWSYPGEKIGYFKFIFIKYTQA